MSLARTKILVTGGAGFIGSHLVDRLIGNGASVAVVDNLSTGGKGNLHPSATLYEIDTNAPSLSEIFEKERPSIVFSLAANTNVPKSVVDPVFDFRTLSGTLAVIEQARLHGVERFVFASSGFIYGNTASRPIKEDEPFRPVSPYAITKRAIEHYLEFYGNVYGLPFVVLRFATVYGPRQVKGAMSDYIDKLSRGLQAEFYGSGEKTRDFVYIEDVIDAFGRCLEIPLTDGQLRFFNIGTSVETTLMDLYARIAGLLGRRPEPVCLPPRPGELEGYSLDFQRARAVLGWTPKHDLESGLRETIRWRRTLAP